MKKSFNTCSPIERSDEKKWKCKKTILAHTHISLDDGKANEQIKKWTWNKIINEIGLYLKKKLDFLLLPFFPALLYNYDFLIPVCYNDFISHPRSLRLTFCFTRRFFHDEWKRWKAHMQRESEREFNKSWSHDTLEWKLAHDMHATFFATHCKMYFIACTYATIKMTQAMKNIKC